MTSAITKKTNIHFLMKAIGILTITFFVFGIRAQSLNLKLIDGSTQVFNLSECKKITFQGNEMKVQTLATINPSHISIVDHIEFYDSGSLGVDPLKNEQPILEPNLYPVPTPNKLIIEYKEPLTNDVYLEISNVFGQCIEQMIINSGEMTKFIDVSYLKSGFYTLHFTSENHRYYKSFVKL